MPSSTFLSTFVAALFWITTVQACCYSCYQENPYSYSSRYYQCGCCTLSSADSIFDSCCKPMTLGQTVPATCSSIASSNMADGSTCSATGSLGTTALGGTTSMAGVSTSSTAAEAGATSTLWVTSTTTVPCTASASASASVSTWSSVPTSTITTAPTTASSTAVSSQAGVSTSESECYCDEMSTGTSGMAGVSTSYDHSDTSSTDCDSTSSVYSGEGNTPPATTATTTSAGTDSRRKRGIMRRDTCECPLSTTATTSSSSSTVEVGTTTVITSSTTTVDCNSTISSTDSSTSTTTDTTTTTAPSITTDIPSTTTPAITTDTACQCTSLTTGASGEGNTPPAGSTYDNRRRGHAGLAYGRGVMRRGECDCATTSVTATTDQAGESTSLSTTTSCNTTTTASSSGGTIVSGQYGTTYSNEGNTPPASSTDAARRGMDHRDASPAPNTHPAGYTADSRKRQYEGGIVHGAAGGTDGNPKVKVRMVELPTSTALLTPVERQRSPSAASRDTDRRERQFEGGIVHGAGAGAGVGGRRRGLTNGKRGEQGGPPPEDFSPDIKKRNKPSTSSPTRYLDARDAFDIYPTSVPLYASNSSTKAEYRRNTPAATTETETCTSTTWITISDCPDTATSTSASVSVSVSVTSAPYTDSATDTDRATETDCDSSTATSTSASDYSFSYSDTDTDTDTATTSVGGVTSMAGVSTEYPTTTTTSSTSSTSSSSASATQSNEGDTPPAGFSADNRRRWL